MELEAPAEDAVSGHTPGPWRIHEHSSTTVVGSSGFVVAACGGYQSTLRDSLDLERELVANACLISAAPDLLAALKSLRGTAPWSTPADVMDQAAAAIAKAEGKP